MATNFTLSQNLPASNDLLLPTTLYAIPAVYLCYLNSRKVCLMRNGWLRARCVAVLCYLAKVKFVVFNYLLNKQSTTQTLHFLVNLGNLTLIWIIFVMMLNRLLLCPDINYQMASVKFQIDKNIFYLLRAVFLYTIASVPSVIIYEWYFRQSRFRSRRYSNKKSIKILVYVIYGFQCGQIQSSTCYGTGQFTRDS